MVAGLDVFKQNSLQNDADFSISYGIFRLSQEQAEL